MAQQRPPRRRRNTRESILRVATDLFADGGYHEASIRAIARRVGIKESSLYKHFKSKQHILTEILEGFDAQFWGGEAKQVSITGMLDAAPPAAILSAGIEFFKERMRLPGMMKTWRILAMEQYRNATARELVKKTMVDRVLDFLRRLFAEMAARKLIKPLDPSVLALEYQNPLFHLMNEYCLRRLVGEDTVEVEEQMDTHARFFWELVRSESQDQRSTAERGEGPGPFVAR